MAKPAQGASVLSQELLNLFGAKIGEALQEKTGAAFEALADEMGKGLNKGLLKAHKNVAKAMQEDTLVLYEKRVEALKKFPSYRVGQNRFSGGALLRALSSEGMFVATAQGIDMGNRVILNQEAAHWYRLNFGAGEQGSVSVPRVLKFGGASAVLRLVGKPDKPFHMPYGIWRTRSSGYQGPNGETKFTKIKATTRGGKPTWVGPEITASPGFYPLSKTKFRRQLSKIEGRNYFEGGLFAFTKELPRQYDILIDEIVKKAIAKARGRAK